MNIPTEVSVALTGVLSVLISSFVSSRISKRTAENEIKKMKIAWNHDDNLAFENEFGEMVGIVSFYIKHNDLKSYKESVEKSSFIRSKSSGDLGKAVDELCNALSENRISSIKEALDRAVEQKRKSAG